RPDRAATRRRHASGPAREPAGSGPARLSERGRRPSWRFNGWRWSAPDVGGGCVRRRRQRRADAELQGSGPGEPTGQRRWRQGLGRLLGRRTASMTNERSIGPTLIRRTATALTLALAVALLLESAVWTSPLAQPRS